MWVAGVSHPRHPAVWAAVQRYLFNGSLGDKVFSKGSLLLQLYAHGATNPTCYDVLPSTAPTPAALVNDPPWPPSNPLNDAYTLLHPARW